MIATLLVMFWCNSPINEVCAIIMMIVMIQLALMIGVALTSARSFLSSEILLFHRFIVLLIIRVTIFLIIILMMVKSVTQFLPILLVFDSLAPLLLLGFSYGKQLLFT